MFTNRIKRIPSIFQALKILIVILALAIWVKSPMLSGARVLANHSDAPSAGVITFASQVVLTTGSGPTDIVMGDFDGDGKLDLANANYGTGGGSTFSVLRNTTSTSGTVTFAPQVTFTTGSGPHGIALADIDQDGKLDVVVTNYGAMAGGSTVSVLLNTSTGTGNISFAGKADFAVGNGPLQIAIGNLDGDVLPDLAVTNFIDGAGTTVTVLLNTTSGGIVSFATPQNFTVGTGPYGLVIGDINQDSKPDIVVANNGSLSGDGHTISVLKNTSSIGSISFASAVTCDVVDLGPREVAIGDLDGDGWPDVAVTDFGDAYHDPSAYGTKVSILRNTTSTPGGTISFDVAGRVDKTVGTLPHFIAFGDFDKDAKLDIVATNFGGTSVSVLQNLSTSGTLSFADKVDFPTGAGPHGVAIGDLDKDGMPDLAVTNYNDGTNSVLLNSFNNPVPTLTTLSSTSATAGAPAFTLTVTGTNFVASSVVQWNGVSQVTTYVSATQLSAAITVGDLATAGIFPVTVFNPTPGGGTSSAVNFTVIEKIFLPIIRR